MVGGGRPSPFSPVQRPVSRCIGGWVVSWAGLDGSGKLIVMEIDFENNEEIVDDG